MALVHTASPSSPSAALIQPSHRRGLRFREQLTSLPIGRDSRGKSFSFSTSLQSPRTPLLPSSPSVQLLESLRSPDPLRSTPRWKNAPTPRSSTRSVQGAQVQESSGKPPAPEKYVQPDDKVKTVLHLERCLEASPKAKETKSSSFPGEPRPVSSDAAFGVAYQGSPSARAVTFVYPQSNTIPCQQSEGVFSALQSRKAERALIPVENTIDGTIHRNYDLLLRSHLYIVGEMHCQRPADQQDYLTISGIEVLPSSDGDGDVVITRFWVLAREPIMPRDEECFKTTVALVLADGLRDLYKVLATFSFRDIKVTKVESRPWKQKPLQFVDRREEGVATYFQYVVFIDFEGSLASRQTQNALSQLQEQSSFLRVLGSYPTIDTSQIVSKATGLRKGLASPRSKTCDIKATTDTFTFVSAGTKR